MLKQLNGIVKWLIGLVVFVGCIVAAFTTTQLKATGNTKAILAVIEKQEVQREIIGEIRRKMSFQDGVVTTKLNSLEKGQTRIMDIITKWEPDNATP